MKRALLVFAVIFLTTFGVTAQTTNGLSAAEIKGQQLVQRLLEQQPAENSTNTGTLEILNKDGETNLYLTITATLREDNNYQVNYYLRPNTNSPPVEWLKIIKSPGHPAIYYTSQQLPQGAASGLANATLLRGNQAMVPFGQSDFWMADLGLEFFNWPDQKVIKHQERKTRECTVLESTNPHPSAGSYSWVDSWIDDESLAPVHAEAYDVNGKLLKIFDPKKVKKVNGQWQLEDMEIQNVQIHSRTWIKFDLSGK